MRGRHRTICRDSKVLSFQCLWSFPFLKHSKGIKKITPGWDPSSLAKLVYNYVITIVHDTYNFIWMGLPSNKYNWGTTILISLGQVSKSFWGGVHIYASLPQAPQVSLVILRATKGAWMNMDRSLPELNEWNMYRKSLKNGDTNLDFRWRFSCNQFMDCLDTPTVNPLNHHFPEWQ